MRFLYLAAAFSLAALPAMADEAARATGEAFFGNATVFLSGPSKAYTLTIGDALVIDMEKRTITVREGVSVDDAAKRVIDALRPILESMK